MQPYISELDRQKLEYIYAKRYQQPVKESKLSLVVNKIWQLLITTFTQEPEMKVWQRSDRFGNTWWEAYNPANGRSATFGNEIELLSWIEKSY